MKFYAVFGILAVLAVGVLAADEIKESSSSPAAAATDKVATGTKSNFGFDSNDRWSLVPNSYGTALAAGGVAVAGIVVLLAIAAVVSPFFGYRLCQIFSTCDAPLSPAYAGDAYSQGYGTSQYPSYQKRSIEYVGPILQALNSAYEKYGNGAAPAPIGLNLIRKINGQ